jgi:hypothetical protein
LLQLLQERRHAGLIFGVVGGAGYDHANAPHPLGLLRTRRERERPNSTQSSNDCDEIAASHCSPKAREYADTG